MCVIGSGYVSWPLLGAIPTDRHVDIPIDVLLCLMMFLRSYILCRFMVLHSIQFQVTLFEKKKKTMFVPVDSVAGEKYIVEEMDSLSIYRMQQHERLPFSIRYRLTFHLSSKQC